jgi:hypothetical protein
VGSLILLFGIMDQHRTKNFAWCLPLYKTGEHIARQYEQRYGFCMRSALLNKLVLLLALVLVANHACIAQTQRQLYSTTTGSITFVSNAPLETITATTRKTEGVLDATSMTFAFAVPITSFEGFNNGLQRQHFYENYMESDKYPEATFSGKIIEQVDLTSPGNYSVRAKGLLKIHGSSRERIIKANIVSNGHTLEITSSFFVPLADHKIEIPRIVNQKIAREIEVSLMATLVLEGRS